MNFGTGIEVASSDKTVAGEGMTERSELEYLFVTGCERSGTTALLHFLNRDKRIILGRERFKFIRNKVAKSHFEPQHFFNPVAAETNYRDAEYYGKLHQRYQSGKARIIGDKVPLYYRNLPHLNDQFPDCRIIFLVRDLRYVAASYNARAANPDDVNWPTHRNYVEACENWNLSISKLRRFFRRRKGGGVLVVPYERFFQGDERWMRALYQFLGLPVTDEVRKSFAKTTKGWESRFGPPRISDDQLKYIQRNRSAQLELYAQVVAWRCFERWQPTTVGECYFCKGATFDVGPNNRLSSTNQRPKCQSCGSLERDRALASVLAGLVVEDMAPRSPLDLERETWVRKSNGHAPARSVGLMHYRLHKIENLRFAELVAGHSEYDYTLITTSINIQRRESLTDQVPRQFGTDFLDLFDFKESAVCFAEDGATGSVVPIFILSNNSLSDFLEGINPSRVHYFKMSA